MITGRELTSQRDDDFFYAFKTKTHEKTIIIITSRMITFKICFKSHVNMSIVKVEQYCTEQ